MVGKSREKLKKKEPLSQDWETILEKDRHEAVYADLIDALIEYELKYKMTSGDFIVAFERGDLPEKEEFFRWRVIYQGYRNLLNNWA